MVVGLDRWREHFTGFEDRYALVGGVACDRLFEEAGIEFRATKDLDVVLLVELLDASFAERFWAFVEAGGYERRAKSDGGKLYRFQNPKDPDYPYMIELFSRAPAGVELTADAHLTPLPIDEEVSSLSAILLDADYYDYLKANLVEVSGLPILSEIGLIPFKARAYLDLSKRKAEGAAGDHRNIRKHLNDVFRLGQLLATNAAFELPAPLQKDLSAFLAAAAGDEGFNPKHLGLAISREEAIERLARAYGLKA
jgi:hypothetical protein